ncbi:hypothetical protein F5Y05DRAFT_388173 [Hypoxylon sp. FL0543]|nr:hypothetical protein F5Y05DRAFT_388173 [Hypoxylon sp. FL0543]
MWLPRSFYRVAPTHSRSQDVTLHGITSARQFRGLEIKWIREKDRMLLLLVCNFCTPALRTCGEQQIPNHAMPSNSSRYL